MSRWETPGQSDEWYTPKYVFDAMAGSLGRSPSTGTALMAIGSRGVRALQNARKLGWLVKTL
jgi:hypothetical protein